MRLRPGVYFYPGANGMDFSGEIDSNTLLLAGESHALVDPGVVKRWDELMAAIRADGLDPADIGLALFTHGHPDHAESAAKCKSELGARVAMGSAEIGFLAGLGQVFYRKEFYQREPSGSRYKCIDYVPPDPAIFEPLLPGPLRHEGREWRLIESPGHSPGGLCLHCPESGLLIAGDNYFPGTIGAYDLPGGSLPSMESTLAALAALDGVDLAVCGHGEPIEGREAVLANYGELFAEVEAHKARKAAATAAAKAAAAGG
jgi:glyoxylase-like metal-dependent hydrolase (beta-lactamase superfamily II)